MNGAIPPDRYLGGDRVIGTVIAQQAGVGLDQLGDYVIIAQVSLPDLAWDIIVGPDVPIDLVPALLRRMAGQLDDRATGLLS